MKRLLLALALAALGACAGGVDPVKVECPSNPSQAMTHAQWEACYGRQDNDPK